MSQPNNLCMQCGSIDTTVSEITHLGQLWKVIVSCNICDVAAIGGTRADAEKNFSEGKYDLEVST